MAAKIRGSRTVANAVLGKGLEDLVSRLSREQAGTKKDWGSAYIYTSSCANAGVISHCMRAIILYLFFLGVTISATAQKRVQFEPGKQPYFLVDTFMVDLKYLVVSPDKIETVNVLKDSNAVAIYGDKAKYGAVIMKTKPNTKLLRVSDILAEFKVPEADQKLRICINKTVMSRPELILIEKSAILGVETTTDRHWIYPEDANSNEKFINIKTKQTDKNGL